MTDQDDPYKDDAWKKLFDLWEENGKTFEVRDDLVVQALGPDRSVRLTMYEHTTPGDEHDFKRRYIATDRNISTMRELAQALLDACDFVEACNPHWTEVGRATREIEKEFHGE